MKCLLNEKKLGRDRFMLIIVHFVNINDFVASICHKKNATEKENKVGQSFLIN